MSYLAGRLAEIIVLDQFSRNVWRNHLVHGPRAFAQDALALELAQELVARGDVAALPLAQRLFAQAGLEDNLRSERSHLAILKRFGRYPHHNSILGRESTAEELAFLQEPGSGFEGFLVH